MNPKQEPDIILTGFDRGIDFEDIKDDLIKAYKDTIKEINGFTENTKNYNANERKLVNRLIYIVTAMIQLINGSRISEACLAMEKFINSGDIDKRVIIKLSKSETTKYKDDGEEFKTKIRYRKLIFPKKWLEDPKDKFDLMKKYLYIIKSSMLKKRVLDYLLKYHNCNTHSLRYAFINYMIYDQKNEPSLIAKHVGHSNLNQLIRYTQSKQSDKLFDIDI
jgi:integrase